MVFHKLTMTGLEHYSTSCNNNKNCYGHLKALCPTFFSSLKKRNYKIVYTKCLMCVK